MSNQRNRKASKGATETDSSDWQPEDPEAKRRWPFEEFGLLPAGDLPLQENESESSSARGDRVPVGWSFESDVALLVASRNTNLEANLRAALQPLDWNAANSHSVREINLRLDDLQRTRIYRHLLAVVSFLCEQREGGISNKEKGQYHGRVPDRDTLERDRKELQRAQRSL